MCVKIGAFWIALYSIIADEHAKTVPIVYTWIQNDFILFRINMENRLDETFPLMAIMMMTILFDFHFGNTPITSLDVLVVDRLQFSR